MRDTSELFWEAQELLRGDREGARRRLHAKAEDGDLNAKYQLAVMLLEWDPDEAVRLCAELDAADVDGAAFYLGGLYFDSDPETAKYWYRRAIDRDDLASGTAALGLGRLLYNEDSPEAVQWLERAHAAGEEGSAFWLAASLATADPDRAIALYNEAAREGESKASYELGRLLYGRGDKESGRAMYERGAALGDDRCLWALFDSWSKDDPKKALKWFVRWVRSGALKDDLVRRWRSRNT